MAYVQKMQGGITHKRTSVFIWTGLLAVAFTLVMLEWSYDRFRLHSAPFLDDVNWINEGLDMLASLRDGGISGFLHHIAATRTLAPYSIVAAVGFALFGIQDWVPYLMNGWLIFSLLAFLEIARRRADLPLRAWFLAAAVALAFPIGGYSIVSFLGDIASGLFIAIGSVAFLEGWPTSESALESWIGTVAWVFAFYGKATLFPETLLIFLLTAALGCLISIREYDRSGADAHVRARSPARAYIWRALVVLLAVLPYYALVAGALRDYLYLTNWGSLRQVWAFKGTFSESLLYYVTGFSGETMLGPALYLALALVLLRVALLFRDGIFEKWRLLALLAIVAIAYALPTFMVNKTPTVGAPFQFLVVLTAATSLYSVLQRLPRSPAIALLLVAAAVILVFRFPQPLDRRDSPAVVARNRTMEGLMAALDAQNVNRDEPVFLTTTGFVSTNTLKYEFVKRHLPLPHFFENPLAADASQFPPLIDQAAFVIATDPDNDEVFYTVPSAFIQAETLALVQQNPAFVEVARFSTWRGKYYHLFGRIERVKNAVSPIASAGISPPGPVWVRGFSSPGPDQRRWSRREFEIEFPAPRGLYAELKLRFFLPQPHIDKLGSITLQADIPHEGHHSETYSQEGVHDFTFRYAIKVHLVSTVPVRFRLNKVVDELGLLIISAELNPIAQL